MKIIVTPERYEEMGKRIAVCVKDGLQTSDERIHSIHYHIITCLNEYVPKSTTWHK